MFLYNIVVPGKLPYPVSLPREIPKSKDDFHSRHITKFYNTYSANQKCIWCYKANRHSRHLLNQLLSKNWPVYTAKLLCPEINWSINLTRWSKVVFLFRSFLVITVYRVKVFFIEREINLEYIRKLQVRLKYF